MGLSTSVPKVEKDLAPIAKDKEHPTVVKENEKIVQKAAPIAKEKEENPTIKLSFTESAARELASIINENEKAASVEKDLAPNTKDNDKKENSTIKLSYTESVARELASIIKENEKIVEKAAQVLISMIVNKKLKVSFHPGCWWISYKNYGYGPIGRRGPNGCSKKEDDTKDQIESRKQLTRATMDFRLATHSEEDKTLFAQIVGDLDKTDDIQVKNTCFKASIKQKFLHKFQEEANKLNEENHALMRTIDQLLQPAKDLGAEIEVTSYPIKTYPAEWYEAVEDYTSIQATILADQEHSILFRAMQKAGLIVSPQWYVDGDF